MLAAVDSVESVFGRVRSASDAGAQGPMQFMPATWPAYGMGGDVQDPRDAILGAANYLTPPAHRPASAGALFAYNPSVDVRRRRAAPSAGGCAPASTPASTYTRQGSCARPTGTRRLTGPGRD